MSILRKIIIILIGSVVASFGMSISIRVGFGGSTLAILWQGLADKWNMTIGQASLIVSGVMLVMVLIYDYKQIHIGTIIHQLTYSFALDIFNRIPVKTDLVGVNLSVMLVGIILFSVGIGIYTYANFGKGPYESICFAIAKKHKWQIKYVRMAADAGIFLLGCMLGGTPGLCTIATIIISGYFIQLTGECMDGRFIFLRSSRAGI